MMSITRNGRVIAISVLLAFSPLSFSEKASNVARAMFTTKIVDREPVDRVLVLNNKSSEIYFFTDLRHFEGQTITHKWLYDSNVQSVVNFKVKGPRWRVYSRKDIAPDKVGKWTVIIQDESGRSLKASVFLVAAEPDKQIILPQSN